MAMDAFRCGCGADLPDNEDVLRARVMMERVDPFGNLHVYVDDGNLEDCWFDRDEDDNVFASIRENRSGAGVEELAVERDLATLLAGMAEAERFAAYGLCESCVDARYESWAARLVADRFPPEPDPGLDSIAAIKRAEGRPGPPRFFAQDRLVITGGPLAGRVEGQPLLVPVHESILRPATPADLAPVERTLPSGIIVIERPLPE